MSFNSFDWGYFRGNFFPNENLEDVHTLLSPFANAFLGIWCCETVGGQRHPPCPASWRQWKWSMPAQTWTAWSWGRGSGAKLEHPLSVGWELLGSGRSVAPFQVSAPLKHDAKYTLLLNCGIQHIIALWQLWEPLLPVDLLLILVVRTFSKMCPGSCGT